MRKRFKIIGILILLLGGIFIGRYLVREYLFWKGVNEARQKNISRQETGVQQREGFSLLSTLPGKIYLIEGNFERDNIPAGKKLDAEEKLQRSPIGRMYKKAFIFKADDLKTPIPEGFKRFINLIEECNAKACLGLVGRYIKRGSKEDIIWLIDLDKNTFELFFHGWDHFISKQYNSDHLAEFQNTGYEHQFTHIVKGIETAKKYLGYTFHTFGAPGNAIDKDTQRAILANSEIKVWLYGMEDKENRYLMLKNNMQLEYGGKESANELIKRYRAKMNEEVITAQLHPKGWNDQKLLNLRKLLDYINADPGRRFFTAWEYYKWFNDKDKIVLLKKNKKEYVLDMSKVQYPHLIEFQSDTPVKVRVLKIRTLSEINN